ncbi:MAG: DUF4474 domain-containing protein [Clostridia bacterium]|nr:DUF4474 domain-containing protein [Clostridia bacterium]
MNKKNTNAIVIAVSVLAVAVVAVVCALILKSAHGSGGVLNAEESTTLVQVAETTKEALTDLITTVAPTTEIVTTKPAEEPTAPPVVVDKEEGVTIPVLDEDNMSHGSAVTPPAPTPSGNLPKDMSFSGLNSMGYKVYGTKEYIYNDDTDPACVQANFGYNRLYDWGAQLIDFSIDTARMKFEYNNKEYMIQIWKGQYISGEMGTIGGEVGLYTRPKGTVSAIGHYNCAPYEEWLNMEMTVLWDEAGNGNYLPQLTRAYSLHWWPTGFVFAQLEDKKNSDPLRVLCRITFKDEEMAQAFAQSLTQEGFESVSSFDPTVKDTYKIYGKDVIFIWQDVR